MPGENEAMKTRYFAVVGLLLLGCFGSGLLIAEAMGDPGGWLGVGYTAAWLLPLLAALVVAWRAPRATHMMVYIMTGLLVLVSMTTAIWPKFWQDFSNLHGPVLAVLVLVVALPTAVWGLRAPRIAGWLLVAQALVPWLGELVAGRFLAGSQPLRVICIPVALAGAMLIADAMSAPQR